MTRGDARDSRQEEPRCHLPAARLAALATRDLSVRALRAAAEGVGAADLAVAEQRLAELSATLGVPIRLQAEDVPVDLQTCGSRVSCYDPYEAGIRIDLGGLIGAWCGDNENCCTMGFHITTATGDRQFLTAGHCNYGTGELRWYHYGNGYIGNTAASMYSAAYQRDVQRVGVPDAETSPFVYGVQQWRVIGSGVANAGATICASLGVSGGGTNPVPMDCGTISVRWTSWFSNACRCTMWGGAHTGISAQGGDSGSPMFSVVSSSNPYWVRAYGVLNSGQYFTWVEHALDHWGASLVTS